MFFKKIQNLKNVKKKIQKIQNEKKIKKTFKKIFILNVKNCQKKIFLFSKNQKFLKKKTISENKILFVSQY